MNSGVVTVISYFIDHKEQRVLHKIHVQYLFVLLNLNDRGT